MTGPDRQAAVRKPGHLPSPTFARTDAFSPAPKTPDEGEDYLCQLMQRLLHETPREARRLIASWYRNRQLSCALLSELAASSPGRIASRMSRLKIADLPRLGAYLEHHPHRGVVLATIHMGDYLLATLAIVKTLRNRKVLLIRRGEPGKAEHSILSKMSGLDSEFEVIRAGETSAAVKAFRHLSRGAVLIMSWDLSGRFGATLPVRLFNQPMRWVSGPARCASLANALLVPFVAYKCDGEHRVDLHPLVPARRRMEIGTVMSRLSSIAEGYIRKFPDQWLHWNLLPEMLEGND